MSCEGRVIGVPFCGFRMLCEASISSWASRMAGLLNGTCTAIWSPSKSALNAVVTSGCSCIALPSTSFGWKAWIERRCSVGARFKHHRVTFQNIFKDIPNHGFFLVNQFAGRFHCFHDTSFDQFADDERLEKFSRHIFWQTALV
jgi:hypothetical protein